jgi:hypothetical protein
MRHTASLVLAALALALPAAAPAQDRVPPTYYQAGGWTVYQSQNFCTLSGSYGADQSFYVTHDRSGNQVAISIYTDRSRAIVDGRPYRLDVAFLNREPDQSVRAYDPVQFSGVATDRGARGYFGVFPGAGFLDDLTRFQLFGAVHNGEAVASFSLDGAPEAVAQLRRCDAEVEQRNAGSGQRKD